MSRSPLILLCWLAGLLLAAGWIYHSIDVDDDLAAFLPDRGRPVERLLISQANRGAVSRLVFVAFEGGTSTDRITASREASARLDELPGVEQLANGAQSLDIAAFESLFPYRYLLGETPPFDVAGLRDALQTRLKELRSPIGAIAKQKLESDPTASFRTLLLSFTESSRAPDREGGVWVSRDGQRTLLLLTFADTGGDPAREAETVAAVRATLRGVAERNGVELLLAGRPALAAEASDSIRTSFTEGSMVASALIITLLLWMYRSFGVLLLGILPLASGVVAGLAVVLAWFGSVHGIALAFGVTLLGIAVDYPIHLFSHHRWGERLMATARSIERPLFLGALTSAGAFAIFGAGSAPGLGQLACFASVGILVAAITLRHVVPAAAELGRIEPAARAFDPLPATAPRAFTSLVVAVVLAAATFLAIRQGPLFESDIAALNPLPDAAKALDRRLRADLGAPDLRYILLLEAADDAESVLARAEVLTPPLTALRDHAGIAGFDTPSRYLPSLARQIERRAALPPLDELSANLREASKGLPFKDGLFEPFLRAVEASRTLAPLPAEAGLGLFAGTPLGAKLDQLLFRADGKWYAIMPISGVTNLAGLQRLTAAAPDAELIDLKALSDDVLDQLRREALKLLALGTASAFLLLVLLRHPLAKIVRSFFVLALSMVVTTAALALLNERLTMLHILSGLLVMGLGIDYTIFFSWPAADDEQRRRTWQALVGCLVSTVLVFGLLASSSINVLHAIGLTVAIGASTTFAVAFAILSKQRG